MHLGVCVPGGVCIRREASALRGWRCVWSRKLEFLIETELHFQCVEVMCQVEGGCVCVCVCVCVKGLLLVSG